MSISPTDALSVRGLGKRYRLGTRAKRDLWALHNVSFDVPRGQILGVIGPNGAGKTTLLKVLSRVTPPTEGVVEGRGRVIPLLAIGAGFQQDMTGRDNVFMNAAMYGIGAADVEQQLAEIFEFAGVTEFADVPVKKYSSGMYIRLAFSVAIHMQPDILLADEVLAVGDQEFQEKCLTRVEEAGRRGVTVLFVSHDMAAITRLCHRVLWINGGEIVEIGDPETVVSRYQNAAFSVNAAQLSGRRSGAHVSPVGEIVQVTLHGADGGQVGAVKANEPVRLRILHRFSKGGYLARYTLHVKARGAVAFRSRIPEDAAIAEPGLYTAEVVIPADLLSDTMYTVDVDVIGINGREWHPMVATNAVTFQVFAPESQQRDALGGVLAPRLPWQVSRAGSPSEAAPPVADAGTGR